MRLSVGFEVVGQEGEHRVHSFEEGCGSSRREMRRVPRVSASLADQAVAITLSPSKFSSQK